MVLMSNNSSYPHPGSGKVKINSSFWMTIFLHKQVANSTSSFPRSVIPLFNRFTFLSLDSLCPKSPVPHTDKVVRPPCHPNHLLMWLEPCFRVQLGIYIYTEIYNAVARDVYRWKPMVGRNCMILYESIKCKFLARVESCFCCVAADCLVSTKL